MKHLDPKGRPSPDRRSRVAGLTCFPLRKMYSDSIPGKTVSEPPKIEKVEKIDLVNDKWSRGGRGGGRGRGGRGRGGRGRGGTTSMQVD